MAGAWVYWLVRGSLSEGSRWLRDVLLLGSGPTALRARAFAAAGVLAYRRGDFGEARTAFEEALALAREAGDRGKMSRVIMNMGSVANMQGDAERGRALIDEAMVIQRELGDWQSLSICLHNLGRVELRHGTPEEAASLLEQSVDTAQKIGYRELIAYALAGFAELALARRELERAARLLGASDGLFDQTGASIEGEEKESRAATLELLRDELGSEALESLRAEGRALPEALMLAEARPQGAQR